MDDIVSLGGQQRRRWPRRAAVTAAALGLAAAGVYAHLPSPARPQPRAHAAGHEKPGHERPDGGPVQLAGLGSGAARLLNHSGAG